MDNKTQPSSSTKTLSTNLKVALVYDWVNTPYGGAEQVVLAFKKLFPKATLFTSIYNPDQAKWANQFKIKTSFLNNLPFFKKNHRLTLPFLPIAFESLNLSEFDLIISITSGLAKGVITNTNQLHLCYLLSPPRFLYEFNQDYTQSFSLLNLPILKQGATLIFKYIKWWDQAAMARPDLIIPLSKLVKSRVQHVYDTKQLKILKPIYPPADMISLKYDDATVAKLNLPKKYCLVVSRLVPYKKIDLAIKACALLKQNLIIVGDGPCKKNWQQLAKSLESTDFKIIFLPSLSQPIVNSLMKNAQLFLAPGIDDFGLSPLQANLFGTPAIINASSGVAEQFQNNTQGLMLKENTPTNLASVISQALSQNFNSDKIKKLAQLQTTDKFLKNISHIIQTSIQIS